MKFTKMHGIGNDYIYVNAIEQNVDNPSHAAKFLSDRHFGVGSDGLVLICPSDTADFKMDMYNSDGSQAEMCGNAIRCVGKYVYDNGFTDKNTITIETLAGIKTLKLKVIEGKVQSALVDMGEPILKPELIPVKYQGELCIDKKITVGGREWSITCVSMGNPHAVTFVEDVEALDLPCIGPKFETHEKFPNKINTEFIQIIDRKTVKMRVWERGAGETLACGTGACAAVCALVLNGLTERKVKVILLGGELLINWDEKTNHVFMEGGATKVFDGEIEL